MTAAALPAAAPRLAAAAAAAWPPAGQGRRGSPGPGSGPTRPRRGRPTPAPPPRRGPACGWRPGPGRRGPARSRAAVLVAQRLEEALVPGEVLLEQPDEALVLAALLDQLGDRLAQHVGDRAALDVGDDLEALGQLWVQAQHDVLGPRGLFRCHSDSKISRLPADA